MTGCGPSVPEKKVALKGVPSVVVDYPAVVVVSRDADMDKHLRGINKKYVRLGHADYTVIKPKAEKWVFVKAHGEQVSLLKNELGPEDAVVLFDRVNDPRPVSLHDFELLVNENIAGRRKPVCQAPKEALIAGAGIVAPEPDTTVESPPLPGLMKPRRMVIVIDDTASRLKFPRSVLPVEYIVQWNRPERHFGFTFSNDLITYPNTDRYFTNGIALELQSPRLANNPLNRLMLRPQKPGSVSYCLSLVQDMYTPTDTRVAPKLKQDRPYASDLIIAFARRTEMPYSGLAVTSRLDLGYFGPYAPGSFLQKVVHEVFPTNDPPQGWETQLATDIIANYQVSAEKTIHSSRMAEVKWNAMTRTGTLYNDVATGARMEMGRFEHLRRNRLAGDDPSKVHFSWYLGLQSSLVGYNALLQGGVFNHRNVFTLKASEISHWVGTAETGLRFSCRYGSITASQTLLSPEYKGGLWQRWGTVSMAFSL